MALDLNPASLNMIGTGLSIAGHLSAGSAARAAGRAQRQAAEYTAQQLEASKGQQRAAAQRASIDEIRKSMALQSRALAVAAASGGGALDPTVLALISGVSAEGQLAAETQIYNGDERARQLQEHANAVRYEGLNREAAGEIASRNELLKIGGTILSGVSKDWYGAPKEKPTKAPIWDATNTKYLY